MTSHPLNEKFRLTHRSTRHFPLQTKSPEWCSECIKNYENTKSNSGTGDVGITNEKSLLKLILSMISKCFLHTPSNGVWHRTTSSGKTGLPLQAVWHLGVGILILTPGSPAEIKQQPEKPARSTLNPLPLSCTKSNLWHDFKISRLPPSIFTSSTNAAILSLLLQKDAAIAKTEQ